MLKIKKNNQKKRKNGEKMGKEKRKKKKEWEARSGAGPYGPETIIGLECKLRFRWAATWEAHIPFWPIRCFFDRRPIRIFFWTLAHTNSQHQTEQEQLWLTEPWKKNSRSRWSHHGLTGSDGSINRYPLKSTAEITRRLFAQKEKKERRDRVSRALQVVFVFLLAISPNLEILRCYYPRSKP